MPYVAVLNQALPRCLPPLLLLLLVLPGWGHLVLLWRCCWLLLLQMKVLVGSPFHCQNLSAQEHITCVSWGARRAEGRHMLLHVCGSKAWMMAEPALTCAGCGSDDSRRGTRHMLKGSKGVILSRRRCCCWRRRGCCSRCSWCCWCSLWGCWAKHVVQVKGHSWHCRRRCSCADCRPSRCHRLHRGHARKRCCCCRWCWWRCGRGA